MALGSTQLLTEMRWSVHRADNLTTLLCQLSRNLEPVHGFLYISPVIHNFVQPLGSAPEWRHNLTALAFKLHHITSNNVCSFSCNNQFWRLLSIIAAKVANVLVSNL